MSTSHQHWHRAIMLVDMNAFFASIEQRDNPALRGKPVAVTNGAEGSCVITCSYEARRYGVKTGMRLKEALQRCPDLIRCPSRPERYAAVSKCIMQTLYDYISPEQEIYSVDECFLDITGSQRLLGPPEKIAQRAKQLVWQSTQLPCSIGVSGDKTTAKFAANRIKPHGITCIPPWKSKDTLAPVPLKEIWGIGPGIARFLAQYGAYTCSDVAKLPMQILSQRLGNPGRRIWLQCQGLDPDKVQTAPQEPQSMGHGKVLPPATHDPATVSRYLRHMADKLSARLRRHNLAAQHYFIGFKTEYSWLGRVYPLVAPDHSAACLFKVIDLMLKQYWSPHVIKGSTITKVQLTALDPQPAHCQGDLFLSYSVRQQQGQHAVDQVREKFGNQALRTARLVNHHTSPNVIAPAWRPDGVRQSIE